jgi:hypothetical protein
LPPQNWDAEGTPEPGYGPPGKGLLATLLDTSFDSLITPKLIKLFYTLALVLITLSALVILAIGIWVFQYGWLLGVAAFIFAPLLWLLQVILVRIFMEAIIVRFKGVEYLRIMKDGPR